MMMDSGMMNQMMGGNMGWISFFGWTTYILVLVVLVLGIAALWRYVSK